MNAKDNYISRAPSSVHPHHDGIEYKKFSDTTAAQVKLWEEYGKDLYYQYKKGTLIAKKTELDNKSYEIILLTLTQCIFQAMREHADTTINDIEERQEALIKVSVMEQLFESCIGALETVNFKLARNSVLPIMHGYINECVQKLAADYESKRKH